MIEIPNEIDWMYVFFASKNPIIDNKSIEEVNKSIDRIYNYICANIDINIDLIKEE